MVKCDSSLPLLQSPMTVSFTLLQPTLGIVHGDLRLVCGCHGNPFHEAPDECSCADVAWLCARFVIHLSATDVAEIAESTKLKGCPQTLVYSVCVYMRQRTNYTD